MTDDREEKAMEIAHIWEELVLKEFPNYRFEFLKLRKDDPKKSRLFKYAYKLYVETIGLLEDDEYRLYILAQLHILKALQQFDAYVDPNILVGPKAWIRWRIWQKHYKKRLNKQTKTVDDLESKTPPRRVIAELDRTNKFLTSQKLQTKDALTEFLKNNKDTFIRWASTKKISPYFVLLCPECADLNNERLGFDLSIYGDEITDVIREYFKSKYSDGAK